MSNDALTFLLALILLNMIFQFVNVLVQQLISSHVGKVVRSSSVT